MQKNIIIVVAVLAVLAAGYYLFDSKPVAEAPAPEVPIVDTTPYVNETYGFQFEYPIGDDGYMLVEPTVTARPGGPVKTVLLVHAQDVAQFANPPAGGEGVPTISLYVFNNTKNERPQAWAEAQLAYSNLGLALSDIEETTVGGALAIRYRADGLYPANMAVVTHDSWVYVVAGSYRDESAPSYRDYEALINSFIFIPEPGQE